MRKVALVLALVSCLFGQMTSISRAWHLVECQGFDGKHGSDFNVAGGSTGNPNGGGQVDGGGTEYFIGTKAHDTWSGWGSDDSIFGAKESQKSVDTGDHFCGGPQHQANKDSDRIYGLGGDDKLEGQGDDDGIFGGPGFDSNLDGGIGPDIVVGNSGLDTLFGGSGGDELDGNDGGDDLWGNAGDDLLYGGNGDDNLYGGDGYDICYGNGGNDYLDPNCEKRYYTLEGMMGMSLTAEWLALCGSLRQRQADLQEDLAAVCFDGESTFEERVVPVLDTDPDLDTPSQEPLEEVPYDCRVDPFENCVVPAQSVPGGASAFEFEGTATMSDCGISCDGSILGSAAGLFAVQGEARAEIATFTAAFNFSDTPKSCPVTGQTSLEGSATGTWSLAGNHFSGSGTLTWERVGFHLTVELDGMLTVGDSSANVEGAASAMFVPGGHPCQVNPTAVVMGAGELHAVPQVPGRS